MIIGVMGAMEEEVKGLVDCMVDKKEETVGDRVFYIGKIAEKEVVLTFSRWGKVAAAITTTILIERYKIKQLIFTGVAGAAAEELNVGDVVVSSKLFQHDMNAEPLLPRFQIPLTGVTFLNASPLLVKQATETINELLQTNEMINLDSFKIKSPQCVEGVIATGDKFMSDIVKSKNIINAMPETKAFEMEGAAVAQVCFDFKIPFVVIRTISDKADHSAPVDFIQFVENIASEYSKRIILGMLKNQRNWLEQPRP